MVVIEEDVHLAHYGILRKSGRYPWGSGNNVTSRSRSFLEWAQDLSHQGLSDPDICRAGMIGRTDHNGVFHPSTTDLRALRSIAKNQVKQSEITQAELLKARGWSNGKIGERMNRGESYVRTLLAPGAREKAAAATSTADMLRQHVNEKKWIDVGIGTEKYMGISKEKLGNAVSMLKQEGYVLHRVKVPQLGTSFETEHKILGLPGTTWGDAKKNQDNFKTITDFSEDGGKSWIKPHPPIPVNPKKVQVRYAEDGGAEADGVLYIREGNPLTSIGKDRYAQVRVQVGPGHYLKGMAIYKDDMPDGIDIIFNTNKSNTGNKFDAMKPLNTKDPDLPFSSIVRQIVENPGHPTRERVTSAMNIVGNKEGSGVEGSWDLWSKTLSSQMLSKQPPKLAREQLALTHSRRERELNDILELTNPTVRRKLLEAYADSTDSAAVHLKAAHMPRQATRVLLPINSLKENEVYAPTFKSGERVVLIRYPHAGTFEIPELVVNTRNPEAVRLLGDARDAIGINSKVAERLSGADFDGDAVLVIPNREGRVRTSPALEGLKNFSPREIYAPYDGMRTMDGGIYRAATRSVDYQGRSPSSRLKGIEMGKVSNLITDMTLLGASHEKIARAVRHSMVVIDAEKHHLNYKESEIRNGIADLRREFQGKAAGGASTLLSRAGADLPKSGPNVIPERKARPQSQGGSIDPLTGQRVFVPTGRTRTDKKGNVSLVPAKGERLEFVDDAFTLVSGAGTRMEKLYAEHSNKMKRLANKARLASLKTPHLTMNRQAKETYAREVQSLTSKLNIAEKNAPRERHAQVVANSMARARIRANPDLETSTKKKIEQQSLVEARLRMGAGKERVDITQREWDAIQAGAISENMLTRILTNADLDQVTRLATPRPQILMTPRVTARARRLLDDGLTRAEVAEKLGVSLTTLDTATNG